MKNNLDELKNNLNEMKNINFKKLRSSLENLVDEADEGEISQPLVTYPDESPCVSEISSPTNPIDTLKFEQKTMNNFKKTMVSLFDLLYASAILTIYKLFYVYIFTINFAICRS